MPKGQKKKLPYRLERVPLAKIERGGGTQARTGNSEDTVADYVEAIKAGKVLPPPVVFKDAKGKLWLADGFHRVEAHARIGAKSVEVEQHVGDQRAAKLHAAGANAGHGLRRSPEDKRRAVAMLLEDAEWRAWSDRTIAEHCHVGPTLVGLVRSGSTVRGGQSEEPEKRIGADGRTINTAAIGAATRERAVTRKAEKTAGSLTPDAAPARPRVTHEHDHESPADDVPDFDVSDEDDSSGEFEGGVGPDYDDDPELQGGEVVEDGAMGRAAAPRGPVDDNDAPVPPHLQAMWELLHRAPPVVDKCLAEAARVWSDFMDATTKAVRKSGTDAHWPSTEFPSLEHDLGPTGAVHSMQAALRRLLPHVVCTDCVGHGCARCGKLGWFSRATWRERLRVDGILTDAGAEG